MSRLLAAIAVALATASCGGEEAACGTVLLTDAQNYSYVGAIDVPSIPTAAAVDMEICWDQVTADLQCHDMDPIGDVDTLSLVRFPQSTQADVEAGLSNDDLVQADISGYVEVQPGDETCALLSDLSFFGTELDVAAEYTTDGGTYLVLLTTGEVPGVGTRMLTFLQPTEDSDVTEVAFPDGCGVLEVDADLQSAASTPICAEGPWTLDWTGLTVDGLGNAIGDAPIDQVMVARYDGMTRSELEDRFLDIELVADELWRVALDGGKTTDLGGAIGDLDGTEFSGFDDPDALWAIALMCTTCYNPAPLFLTFVEPS